ncbi:MAG: AAA family ATPase [Chitinispirillales bacterium]|jgi:predicted AAA+ superfamily ATPase|nr:AAA family ATPase [Chitinispirillales bacterium]
MYRTAIEVLTEWKLNTKKKPLIFLGARQVGKTWLLSEFGRTQYSKMLYINFEAKDAPREIFQENFNIDRIITLLNAYGGLKITPDNTLLVFDEIQTAPQGVTALKYFYENAPEYQIIAAGSLLGINLHPGESFPVGKVDFLTLYPLSFTEFLLAMGEPQLVELIEEREFELVNSFGSKLINYLRYYFFVGGMPEAVLSFSQNRDWNEVRKIQKNILKSYESDFSKHAPKEILPRINMVWKSIPSQLSKENKKFIYGAIKEGGRAKDFELAIQWLTDAGLLHKIYNVSKPALPLAAYSDLSAFKLFHNDVGLLAAMTNLRAKTIIEGDAVFTEFKSALTEQFVFQQLIPNENLSIHYFTFDNSKYEVDFIVQNENDEIIPIEAKSGENLRARSFRLFCENFKPQTAIRTSLSNYRKEDWMTNVPLYIIGNIFNC